MRAALPFFACSMLLLPGCGLHGGAGNAETDATGTAKSEPHNDIDLAVSNLAVTRDPARAGAWIMTFTVSNLGSDVTPYAFIPHVGMAYRPIPWVIAIDGDTVSSGTVAGLTGNDQTTCTVELDTLPPGAISLDVTVDPNHTIPDTKPGNNHASVLVTVGGAG